MMLDELDPKVKPLIERLATISRDSFAVRADQHDSQASFPCEDFKELIAAGLHAPSVPEAYGGKGLYPGNQAFALWMMTKFLAKADMSLARCWEGHVNSQAMISAMGTDEQKKRWFEGIVDRGEIWVAWSGEPQTKTPGQNARFGTRVSKVRGGYIVDGTKVFATSAGHANKAILLVNTEGVGGARHSSGSSDHLLLLACDLSDPSVSFDDSWWDPIGMRGTVSYLARFNKTFIPEEDLLGTPGQYLRDAWQTRFSPHYGSSFLGGAEAAYDFAIESLKNRNGDSDPYVEHRIAKMALNLETAHLWLKHVSFLWDVGRVAEAKAAGNKTRYQLEVLAAETVENAIHICGARGLVRPSPLERIYRDLTIYRRHDNLDHILATIGKEALGVAHDSSFFRVDPNEKTTKSTPMATSPDPLKIRTPHIANTTVVQ